MSGNPLLARNGGIQVEVEECVGRCNPWWEMSLLLDSKRDIGTMDVGKGMHADICK